MNGKYKIAAGIMAGTVAAAAVLTAGINHKATYAVFRNLTARKLELDEHALWNGGAVFERVPYAEDSLSQYLDLYIPESGSDSEKPRLFVMVHGGGFIGNDSQSRQPVLMVQYFR